MKSMKIGVEFDSAVLNIALDTLKLGKQALVFVNTKKSAEKTAEEILTQAKHKAGLSKNITPHTLRRSFATHHINQNTRLEFIQSMMGHKDIRTTRGYQYITPAHLESVRSPHDFL